MSAEIGPPAETLAERDARMYAWLDTVSVGDIVTVRLNSTDILTGKVYEAPDPSGRTALYVNTTLLRFGNGYPGHCEPVTAPAPPGASTARPTPAGQGEGADRG